LDGAIACIVGKYIQAIAPTKHAIQFMPMMTCRDAIYRIVEAEAELVGEDAINFIQ
jgi:hypothetical protein